MFSVHIHMRMNPVHKVLHASVATSISSYHILQKSLMRLISNVVHVTTSFLGCIGLCNASLIFLAFPSVHIAKCL